MMSLFKIISLIILLFSLQLKSFGQHDGKAQALQELKNLSVKYKDARFLSFDVLYRYSIENKPGLYLDSLKGNCKLSGSDYAYQMDNTEVISTAGYAIMIFKEDKIMYLSKPAANSKLSNPLLMLDSFFVNNPKLNCSITAINGGKKIAILFPQDAGYKKMEYFIDSKTGFIKKAVYWVKAEQLYDPSVRSNVDPSAGYAVVEVVFNHYATGLFGAEEFDAARYFKITDKQYVTVAPYDAYKIFLGTPNL